jgi:hypothetical protein
MAPPVFDDFGQLGYSTEKGLPFHKIWDQQLWGNH